MTEYYSNIIRLDFHEAGPLFGICFFMKCAAYRLAIRSANLDLPFATTFTDCSHVFASQCDVSVTSWLARCWLIKVH